MPLVPNMLERLAVLQLNLGPGPLLDLLGAAAFRATMVVDSLGMFETLNVGAEHTLSAWAGAGPGG